MRRVLITGGFGYLGGRIATHFASGADWEVTISTRRACAKTPGWLRGGRVVEFDPATSDSLAAACEGIHAIVHLAGANENFSAADPAAALNSTTLGTLRLLRAAEEAGVERFLYFSTVHAYGKLAGVITENTLPQPVHPYAITHRAAEDFVLASSSLLGVVLRLSNAIGAPAHREIDRWTLAGNDLCRQAIVDRRLVLHSSGLARRDFIPLTDVCRATEHLIGLENPPHRLFNVGGEGPIAILGLAAQIASRCEQLFGYRPEIIRPAPRPGEAFADFRLSSERLEQTGFRREGTVAQEIDQTLHFCRREFGRTDV